MSLSCVTVRPKGWLSVYDSQMTPAVSNAPGSNLSGALSLADPPHKSPDEEKPRKKACCEKQERRHLEHCRKSIPRTNPLRSFPGPLKVRMYAFED